MKYNHLLIVLIIIEKIKFININLTNKLFYNKKHLKSKNY